MFSILRFLNVFNIIFTLLQDFRKWLYPCKIFQVHYSSILACLLLTSATSEFFAFSFLSWNCYLKRSHTLNSFSAQERRNDLNCCLTKISSQMWGMSLGTTKEESQRITKTIYIKILEKKSTITKPTMVGKIWISKSISFFYYKISCL